MDFEGFGNAGYGLFLGAADRFSKIDITGQFKGDGHGGMGRTKGGKGKCLCPSWFGQFVLLSLKTPTSHLA